MSATKGYYSVIQYCPDASRQEAANIGVLLLCPDIQFVRARTAAGNDRVRRFFKGQPIDLKRVNAAKRAIEHRVETDSDRFRTPDDLVRFVETRGNDIVLTPPRPVTVMDAEQEIDQLFEELVGGRSRRDKGDDFPEVDAVFRRPSLEGRILFKQEVSVPVSERRLSVPYAFHNGVFNLVKPHWFRLEEGKATRATSTAMLLAIEGDLIARHPVDGQRRKLIVMPAFEPSAEATGLRHRVDSVLSEYKVRVVHRDELGSFADEIEREAHA